MQPNTQLEDIATHLKQYVQTNIELTKIEVIEQVTTVTAKMISYILIAFFSFLFILFLSFYVALSLSNQLGNNFSGFGIVTMFYLLLTVTVLYGKKKLLSHPIREKLIGEILKNNSAN